MRRNVSIFVGLGIVLLILLVIFLVPKGQKQKKLFSSGLINQAEAALSQGKLRLARDSYKKILELSNSSKVSEDIQSKIESLNMKILFSPVIDSCSIEYVVKPNDALINIAKKFSTTVVLIKRSNELKSNTIHPDQKLKVNKCKFSIVIDKSQNLLFLIQNGEIINTYHVSTGKNNSTPLGKFKIVNKLKNPTWFKTGAIIPPDSPKNVLGTRWMGLNIKGYGIHGNRDANDIGKQVTAGCIRMKNKKVEELYDIVPRGTVVDIVD